MRKNCVLFSKRKLGEIEVFALWQPEVRDFSNYFSK